MTREEVIRLLGVSRETSGRLEAYVALLEDWQPRLGLIGPGTVDDIWTTHILDCGQIARHVPRSCRRLLDLGTGAGLPGLVLAMMGVEGVAVVESDEKKLAFLHAAARSCDIPVTVIGARIEDLPRGTADVVTARALAPLEALIPLALPLLGEGGIAIFPKGGSLDMELKTAALRWHMWFMRHASLSDNRGSILVLDRVFADTRP